jgi:predicted RNA binding protein YcfA (HicA-like mRNA interferase family)
MKRRDLIRHLESNDCVFFREGANHTIYKNMATGAMSAVPRHREIKKAWCGKFAMILASSGLELLLNG